MRSEGLKENMDKERKSTKARVTLGRRVRKTRLMDEMDWWTRVVARRRLDACGHWKQAVSGYTRTPRETWIVDY